MGRLKKGINGGFSGKVGNVIGSSWKSIDYIKGVSTPSKKKPSKAQLAQQESFALAVNFLTPIKELLNFSLKSLGADRATGFNMGIKYTMQLALKGIYPNQAIDYPKVLISIGSLLKAENITLISVSPGTIDITMKVLINDFNAFDDDKVVVLAYNETQNFFLSFPNKTTRIDGALQLSVPENFSGEEVHIYIFYTSRNGKRLSNSVYAGSIRPV